MKIVVRDRAMQISDIVNIESLALALRLKSLALALVSLALLTSLIKTTFFNSVRMISLTDY